MNYRPEIDGLRAVAVLSVILYHAGFKAFSGGFIGVDVFFVVSGFLITSILVNDLSRGTFSIARFYERRARRILPALFLVIGACIVPAWILLLPQEFDSFWRSILAVVFFVSNIVFWRESGYFDTVSAEKPLLHTWSLAVEEQYYLLFPLFMLLVWRFDRRAITVVLVVVALFSLVLSEWASVRMASANFFLLPTRAWQLLVGSICAMLVTGAVTPRSEAAGWLGFGLVLYAVYFFDSAMRLPGLLSAVPVIGTALILVFARQSTVIGQVLSAAPMVKVGLISYSAYLWHQPVFAFSRIYFFEPLSFGLRSALVLLSLVLAYYSWRLVETPFRSASRVPVRRLVLSLGVGAVALTVFGAAGMLSAGFERLRFDMAERTVLDTIAASPMRDACHAPQNESALSRVSCIFNPGGALATAVIGNSHAVELAYALGQVRAVEGLEVRQYSISNCPHDFGAASGSLCGRWHAFVVAAVAGDASVAQVVLSYRNDFFMDDSAALESLDALITVLLEAGKQVVLVLQAPVAERAVTSYVRLRPLGPKSWVPGMTRPEWGALYAPVLAHVAGFSGALPADLAARFTVVDPADQFCIEEQCFVVAEGSALYFDDNHMSVAGATRVARAIGASVEMR